MPSNNTEKEVQGQLLLIVAIFGCFIVGGLLIYLSEILKSPTGLVDFKDGFIKVLHEVGVLFMTVTVILFGYEFIMRKHVLKETQKELKKAIDDVGIQKDILELVRKTMPSSYMNLIDSGVSDAFLNLNAPKLLKRIEANKNIIKISKIFMPFINTDIFKEDIIKSIVAGNNYKIVLCDFELEEALARRARVVTSGSHSAGSYKQNIIQNIQFFNDIWEELKDQEIEGRLEFRLHEDFIGSALIGFDDYFLLGLYLNGKLATQGMQFLIEKDTPEGTIFYRELDAHFKMQWNNAYKEVQFSEDGANCVFRDIKKNLNADKSKIVKIPRKL